MEIRLDEWMGGSVELYARVAHVQFILVIGYLELVFPFTKLDIKGYAETEMAYLKKKITSNIRR